MSPVPLPTVWDAGGTNVRWKVSVAGEGWSQPVVWGDRVFLTLARAADPADADATGAESNTGGYGRDRPDLVNVLYRYEVVCRDADTGRELWRTAVKTGTPPLPRHSTNTYATETPVTDGKRVYAYFGMNGVYCLDSDGTVLWQKDLGVYPMRAGWGTASSPVLHDGTLFLQVDNEQQSFLTALDGETGEELWRVDRDEASQYSSPFVWKNSLRTELIAGGQVYRAYDPATGDLLWSLDMNKGRSSATPVAFGDRLYVGNEFRNRGGSDDGGGRLYRVRPGGTGDLTPPGDAAGGDVSGGNAAAGGFIDWRVDHSGIQMASPTHCGGNLYFFQRRLGTVHCVDAATGRLEYKSRVPGARAFWASPWADGTHVFALDDEGNTHVLKGGDGFEVVRVNELGEQAWGTPAVAGGRIYLRTVDHLYCIGDATEDAG